MKLLIAMSCVVVGLVSMSDTTSAQLFRDEMIDVSAWSANVGGTGDSQFEFNYDYSIDGIPEAPNKRCCNSGRQNGSEFSGSRRQ